MKIVGYFALLWGLIAVLGAQFGWTPDWLGRPFGALIGVLLVCTGILTIAIYEAPLAAERQARRPTTYSIKRTTDLFAASNALKRQGREHVDARPERRA